MGIALSTGKLHAHKVQKFFAGNKSCSRAFTTRFVQAKNKRERQVVVPVEDRIEIGFGAKNT